MKEKLYTLELMDAVKAGDECMFCWLERKLEQENLEFVLGSSYMEGDIRGQTSETGFCRYHTKKMFDYGNTLGNAWILKSRLEYVNRELKQKGPHSVEGKSGGLLGRFHKGGKGGAGTKDAPCYLCERIGAVYGRMWDTFVYLLQNDEEFGQRLMGSKGFCLPHYAHVQEICGEKAKPRERELWLPRLKELMARNLDRVQEDIDWLIEKYDYRNKDADWKQSQDAVPRTMQKLVGGRPADPDFRGRK